MDIFFITRTPTMYSTSLSSPLFSSFSSTQNPRKIKHFSIPFRCLRLLPLSYPPPVLPLRTATATVTICSGGGNHSLRKPPPDKNLLKAKDIVRDHLSSLSTTSIAFDDAVDYGQLRPNQAVGLVAAAQANFMRVIVECAGGGEGDGESEGSRVGKELLCVVRALLKKMKRRVLVGDKVLVGSVDWVDGRGMIENAFPRRTEITDPPVANVDHLVVMFSFEEPKLEPFLLTRFLVEAETTGIPVTLVLNKVELVSDEMISSWESRLHAWGYRPLFCSVDKEDGLKQLEVILKMKTTVIVGPSGVGKSSLINTLRRSSGSDNHKEDDDWKNSEGKKWDEYQRVGSVSQRSGRGKHTTRHVSLLSLSDGGFLADTPGFNQPLLLQATKKTLAETFPEIRNKLNASDSSKCSFNNCLHIGEPGCVVKGDWERYPYYLQLLDEIKVREEFQLRTFGTKRESDVRYKMGDLGVRKAEPRLELKRHRRISRKQLNQAVQHDLEE